MIRKPGACVNEARLRRMKRLPVANMKWPAARAMKRRLRRHSDLTEIQQIHSSPLLLNAERCGRLFLG